MIATEKAPMKRLILVLVTLVMLPVLGTAPASNAPTIQVEDTATSGNSTITITMTGVDD